MLQTLPLMCEAPAQVYGRPALPDKYTIDKGAALTF